MASSTATKRRTKTNIVVSADGPQVYSYGRFSDPKQAKGTSKKRQNDKPARDYAKKIGLPFNESLKLFDAGKSAFHGNHLKSGFLGKFYDLIKAGRIAAGSVLVIEQIDRFGRQETDEHLFIFLDFVRHGVSVYTPTNDTLYSRESINNGLIYDLISRIRTAYEESKKKSDRSKKNWEFKREQIRQTGKVNIKVPHWFERIEVDLGDGTTHRKLVLDKHGKPVVIRAAQKSIIMAYEQSDKGVGKTTIANYLLKNAPWKRDWSPQYVRNLLSHPVTSRQVIGEVLQKGENEPIKLYANLFEKHMGLYERVQAKLRKKPKSGGGRKDQFNNLLQKLVKCGYCGHAMHFKDGGIGNHDLLACYDGCLPSMRYDEVEQLVLNNSPLLRPDHVLPSKSDEAKQCESLRQRVEGTRAKLESTQRKIGNLLDDFEDETNADQRKELRRRANERRVELAKLRELLEAETQQLEQAEHGQKAFRNWQATFPTLMEQLHERTKDGFANIELRHRMNGHLKEFIERIEIFSRGHSAEYNPETDDGDRFYEEMDAYLGDTIPGFPRKEDRAFIEYVISLRLTKLGRFVRIKWANGNQIDLVPPGSIASGYGLSVGPPGSPLPSVEIIRPDLDQLNKQFKRKPRKPR